MWSIDRQPALSDVVEDCQHIIIDRPESITKLTRKIHFVCRTEGCDR